MDDPVPRRTRSRNTCILIVDQPMRDAKARVKAASSSPVLRPPSAARLGRDKEEALFREVAAEPGRPWNLRVRRTRCDWFNEPSGIRRVADRTAQDGEGEARLGHLRDELPVSGPADAGGHPARRQRSAQEASAAPGGRRRPAVLAYAVVRGDAGHGRGVRGAIRWSPAAKPSDRGSI